MASATTKGNKNKWLCCCAIREYEKNSLYSSLSFRLGQSRKWIWVSHGSQEHTSPAQSLGFCSSANPSTSLVIFRSVIIRSRLLWPYLLLLEAVCLWPRVDTYVGSESGCVCKREVYVSPLIRPTNQPMSDQCAAGYHSIFSTRCQKTKNKNGSNKLFIWKFCCMF